MDLFRIFIDKRVDDKKLTKEFREQLPILTSDFANISINIRDGKKVLEIDTTKISIDRIKQIIDAHVFEIIPLQADKSDKTKENHVSKPTSGFLGTMNLAFEELDKEIKQQLSAITKLAEDAKVQINQAVNSVRENAQKQIQEITQRLEKSIQEHDTKISLIDKKQTEGLNELRKKIEKLEVDIAARNKTVVKVVREFVDDMAKSLE